MHCRCNRLGLCWSTIAIELKKTKMLCFRNNLKRRVIGFDINQIRLKELEIGLDRTNEISKKELLEANFYCLTNKIASMLMFLLLQCQHQ